MLLVASRSQTVKSVGIVGRYLPKTDAIHKVTIIPRGMALGLTQFLPKEDSRSLTKLQAESLIAVMYGGRAAEELIFKDYTTGAGNDIERATEIARRMVCEWGMSEKLGPLSYEQREGPVFVGMQQNSHARSYSEHKAEEIDREVYRIIQEGYNKSLAILRENEKVLHVMAQCLLEYETIEGEEVELIISGGTLEEIRSRRDEAAKHYDTEQAAGHEELKAKEKKDKEEVDRGSGQVGTGDPVTA